MKEMILKNASNTLNIKNMKKYKLIKQYPGSPSVGTIVKKEGDSHYEAIEKKDSFYSSEIELYPEFWEEITNNKLVIKERWEERVINIVEICVVDENGDTIDNEILLQDTGEITDRGDKEVMSIRRGLIRFQGIEKLVLDAVDRLKSDNSVNEEL